MGEEKSTPSLFSRGPNWGVRELDRKADMVWAKGEFRLLKVTLDNLSRDIADIKSTNSGVLGEARKALDMVEGMNNDVTQTKILLHKPHRCLHVDDLNEIRSDVTSWTKWWKMAVFTVIGAVIVGAGGITGWLYMHQELKSNVANLTTTVGQIERSVDTVVSSQKDLRMTFKEMEERTKRKNAEQVEEMKGALRSVLKESGRKRSR